MSTQRAEVLLQPRGAAHRHEGRRRKGRVGGRAAGCGPAATTLQGPVPGKSPPSASHSCSRALSRVRTTAARTGPRPPARLSPRLRITNVLLHLLSLCGSTCTSLPGALKANSRAPVASPLCASAGVPKNTDLPSQTRHQNLNKQTSVSPCHCTAPELPLAECFFLHSDLCTQRPAPLTPARHLP